MTPPKLENRQASKITLSDLYGSTPPNGPESAIWRDQDAREQGPRASETGPFAIAGRFDSLVLHYLVPSMLHSPLPTISSPCAGGKW